MKYAAVIFDLDGTLLDTIEDIADCTNRTLAERGFPAFPLERYRRWVGDGLRKLFESALPKDNDDPQMVESCMEQFRGHYGEGWNAKTKPFAGVAEIVTGLRASGCKTAILSNKPHAFAMKCIGHFFSLDQFDVSLGQIDDTPAKPAPAGALRIIEKLGAAKEKVAMVGDTPTDVKTALAAGIHPIGVSWGYRPVEEILAAGAEQVARSPRELLGILLRDEPRSQ
jgi:phosphoglycolate phosphatase